MGIFSFKAYLAEVFDKPYPFKADLWPGDKMLGGADYRGSFTTEEGDTYVVQCTRRAPRAAQAWEFEFYSDTMGARTHARLADKGIDSYQGTLHTPNGQRGLPYGMTGMGDPFRVYATVMAMLRDFIVRKSADTKGFPPERITLVTKEPSQVKLLQRLMSQASRYLPHGWTAHQSSATGRGEVFVLTPTGHDRH